MTRARFDHPPGPDSTIPPIQLLEEPDSPATSDPDPGVVIRTCADCGAMMAERNSKLICRCGYFLSCSDDY